MKYGIDNVRRLIPESKQDSFDDIVCARVLGASNHIRMIADMYIAIAETEHAEAQADIDTVKNYFIETRGKSSYAIVTALNDISEYISKSNAPSYCEKVKDGISQYFCIAGQNTKMVLDFSRKILSKMNTVMVYDYSSTVEKAINSCRKKLIVYVPESRAINGGYPYIKSFIDAGHKVCFIPDASMLTVLNIIDAVFIGAETFYPDGTAFNTVGSDMLAELCKMHHVPYYVITPMLKADLRSIYGDYKETIPANIKDRMSVGWSDELKDKVCFDSIELVPIEAEFITYFITERGIIRPQNLFQFFYSEVYDEKK